MDNGELTIGAGTNAKSLPQITQMDAERAIKADAGEHAALMDNGELTIGAGANAKSLPQITQMDAERAMRSRHRKKCEDQKPSRKATKLQKRKMNQSVRKK